MSSLEILLARAKLLEVNQELIRAKRELAKSEGKLSGDLNTLLNQGKPESEQLLWEEHKDIFGLRLGRGYTLKDLEREEPYPSEDAYYCNDCSGWVAGKPLEEEFDNIGVLSGSAGTRLKCNLCETVVEEVVTRMSLL